MLGWFHENNTTIYLVLGAALLILGAIWFRTQDRRFLKGLIGVAGLLVALILLDVLGPESVGRETKRKIKTMAGAVQLKKMDAITQNIAESFEYEGLDKTAMTRAVQGFINSGQLTEIVVWDFEPPEVTPAKNGEPGKAKLAFKAKPKGTESPEIYFRCVAQFVRESDGQYRLKTFDIYTMPHGQLVRIPQMPLP